MGFDYHIHGLWILGAVFLMLGTMISGNIEWVEGTTPVSFTVALVISMALILIAGVCWISSAVNSRQEQK